MLQAGFLVDMIAARQLFAFHLPDMCKHRSMSNELFDSIADSARSENSLLSVLGYFPKQEVTLCSSSCSGIALLSSPQFGCIDAQ